MVRVGGALALLLLLLITPAHAQRPPEWVLLGEKTVGFAVDRDVINVTHNEDWFRNRSFSQLHFVAERNDVHMMSIRLVYINGFVEDFRVDQLIRAGSQLPIDLRGDRSFLRRIEMTYRARPNFRGEAIVRVYGEPSRPRRPSIDTSWLLLGEKSVGFLVDRDVINVGHNEDWFRTRAFRTLHFVAERSDIHMMSIRLVYFNGFAEDFRVDQLIRDGASLPIDLRGDRSFLRRIEMVYRGRPNFRGQALIRVYGEPARRGPPGPGAGPGPGGPSQGIELLGRKSVGLIRDRDVIPVGRTEGRFRAIFLKALNNDIEIIRMTVVYANGEPERISLPRKLRRNDQTDPIELAGRRGRAIDRIELDYRSNLNLRGEAVIEVYGIH